MRNPAEDELHEPSQSYGLPAHQNSQHPNLDVGNLELSLQFPVLIERPHDVERELARLPIEVALDPLLWNHTRVFIVHRFIHAWAAV